MMTLSIRAVSTAAAVVAASLVIEAQTTYQWTAQQSQLQLADDLFAVGRYPDALDAYKRALALAVADDVRAARAGVIQSALRTAQFDLARAEADELVASAPGAPDSLALSADTLWASGLFEEAEARYQEALGLDPNLARAHLGMARSLAARSRLAEAMKEAQTALGLSPGDLEIHHTIGAIFERLHNYAEAARSFSNYVSLLPRNDHGSEANWSRSEIAFLKSFGDRVPLEMDPRQVNQVYTTDFRVENEKVVIRAGVNGAPPQDFVVDTGAETTVISRRTARRQKVQPISLTISAGLGDLGLRGLQRARMDTLDLGPFRLRNVPCLIQEPAVGDVPITDVDILSPIALGFSMVIDYKTRKISFGKHLPAEAADFELPMYQYRLATVRGTVDGQHAANFVVDTGSEGTSISQATARAIGRSEPARRIALKVYGLSGWDKEAFLLPGVNLSFQALRYTNIPVVVLNLNTLSALVGFQLGGIVGHRFLSEYRVGIDLERSVLRLRQS
jgi:tetratricopeptide (TPR) repeat protein